MKKHLIIFSIFFVFFLIIKTPASLILPMFVDIKATQIQQINGSIWSGSVKSQLFNKLTWSFKPSLLFKAHIAADVIVNINTNNNLKAVIYNSGDSIYLQDITASITLAYLRTNIKNIPSIINSEVVINNAQLVLQKNKNSYITNSASATMILKNVVILNNKLGDYNNNISFNNNIVIANVSNSKNAKLDTKLTIKFLLNNKKLNIKGTLKAKDKKILDMLKSYGISNNINYSQSF